MGLFTQTILIFSAMAAVCALPLVFQRLQAVSSLLFLLGTGALAGICIFDLFPEIVQMGGPPGVMIVAAVSACYALVHLFHLRHHQHPHDTEGGCGHRAESFTVFFVSITSHCFASGILLAVSHRLQPHLAAAVFLAMLAHKAYECMVFMSIVLGLDRGRLWKFAVTLAYCLALPAGVAVDWLAGGGVSQTAAVYISCIAVGSMLGCLIFDFLLPSLRQMKSRRIQVAWIAAGLLLTRLLAAHF